MAGSRLALIAIRSLVDGAEREAVVVGTVAQSANWREGDWRYALYSLPKLERTLREGKDPLAYDAGTGVEDEESHLATLVTTEVSGLTDLKFEKAFLDQNVALGSGKSVRRREAVVRLDHVERICLFTHDESSPATLLANGPYVALDTASARSSILLFPQLANADKRGELAAFSVHACIDVAINAHRRPSDSKDDAIEDTAMLLDGGAVRKDNRDLWTFGLPKGQPPRGAVFDQLRLRCSIASPKDKKPTTSSGHAVRGDFADLASEAVREKTKLTWEVGPKSIAKEGGVPQDSGDLFLAHRIPLLAALDLEQIKGNKILAQREFGFRVCQQLPLRLIWRFELTILGACEYGQSFTETRTLHSVLPELRDGPKLLPLLPKIDKEDVAVLFAEEQRFGDVRLALEHVPAWRTILTASVTNDPVTPKAKPLIQSAVTRYVLGAHNDATRRLQSALKVARDGRPISLLPLLTEREGGSWHAVGFVFNDRRARRPERRSARLVSFEPAAADNFWTVSGARLIKATATLKRFITTDRRFPEYTALIGPPAKQDRPTPGGQPGIAAGELVTERATRFMIRLTESTQSRDVIIGALRLSLAKEFDTSKETNGHIDLHLLEPDEHQAADPGQLSVAIGAQIVLPVEAINPAGQDDVAGSASFGARKRRAATLAPEPPDPNAPLLFPLDAQQSASKNLSVRLTAEEAVTRDLDHTVALSLRSITETRQGAVEVLKPSRVLVIDPKPFRVAAVEYPQISNTATSESNEVAVWNESGEGGLSWRVRDDGQSISLLMPPQTIGEAMEKNRNGVAGLPPDIAPNTLSAARFGCPTIVRIDPTFADTSFREPGWNLRRILGSATQRLPGARLLELRLELLYGLLARVNREDLRITELAGAIGEPALPLPAEVLQSPSPFDPVALHAKTVNALLDDERWRLAVDKLYRLRPDEFLRFDEGVSFRIRRRVLDALGTLEGGPATPLRWPIAGEIPAQTGGLIDPEILARTFSSSTRNEEAFPGGLAWAFESANVLMRVFGRPESDGGNLGGIYLTSHGGYGSQRALFDQRRSIIETESTQGRVHRYRLERVGRIAGLWHPAKHVLVYERTVVPPAQFYNAAPIGLRQDEHLGRAIPRKVQEFVEILKPVRRYPEDTSSIRANGFLVGAEFKSTRINVDSAWGSDVRREGWQVPLWNNIFEAVADSDKSATGTIGDPDSPANLYPKPQVRVITASPDGEITIEVDEPEKLYFYTSVVDGEDDRTDLWQPVRDVDFPDLPRPANATPVLPKSSELTDALWPAEAPQVPGFDRFTLGLVPAKQRTSIGHGRVANGPAATLRNVTIARSITGDAAAPEPFAAAHRFGKDMTALTANVKFEFDRVAGQVAAALEQLDRDTSETAFKARAKEIVDGALGRIDVKNILAGEAGKVFGNVPADLFKNLPSLCEGLGQRARAEIDGRFARFQIVSTSILKEGATAITSRLDTASGVAAAEIARARGVMDDADDMARRLELGAEQIKSQSVEAQQRLVDELKAFAANAKRVKEDLLSKQSQGRVDVQAQLAAAALDSIVRDLKTDLEAVRERTSTGIDALRQLLGTAIHRQAAAAIALVRTLRVEVDTCHDAVKAAASNTGNVDQACVDAAAKLRAPTSEARQALAAPIRALRSKDTAAGILRIVTKADAALAQLEGHVGSLERQARALGEALGQPVKRFDEFFTSIKPDIDAAVTSIEQGLQKILFGADLVLDNIEGHLTSLLDLAYRAIGDDNNGLLKLVVAEKQRIKSAITQLSTNWQQKINEALEKVTDPVLKDLDDSIAAIKIPIEPAQLTSVLGRVRTLAEGVRHATGVLRTQVAEVESQVAGVRGQVGSDLQSAITAFDTKAGEVRKALDDELVALSGRLKEQCTAVDQFFADIEKKFKQQIEDVLQLDAYKTALEQQLKTAIDGAANTIAEIKSAVAAKAAEITHEVEGRARELTGTVQKAVRDRLGTDLEGAVNRAEGVYQKGDSALHAIRALGDPPKTDSLGFNRPEVAYVLGEANKIGIDMTPALALVNRAADQVAAAEKAGKAVGELLDSFGVRLPVNELADQLVPQKLKGLSVAELLPDVAGIDFKGLLKRVGFPDLDNSKAIKLRHGFDAAARRAWMEADIDVPFAESVPLLAFGPVQIMIDTARFTSRARLSSGSSGIERRMNGQIFGNWRVISCSQTILTFRQTGLHFDDAGRIDFRIQPDRVELAETLKFVTDLMKATGQKGGLRIEPFMRGGIPSGVAATLDMVLPPVQTGAFGISDLSLHVLFGIAAIPRFEIVSELSVGSRLAPFTLSVWILNGGGYLTQRLSFVPAAKPKPLMTYTLEIGVLVGLGIGFSFGIVSGGVWLQVGCSIAVTWTTAAGGNTTTMRVFLLARGNVDVAGLITASILLLFEVSYDGERIIGAGTLSIRVKISVFFELSVDQHVEYVFAGEKKQEQVGSGSYAEAYC